MIETLYSFPKENVTIKVHWPDGKETRHNSSTYEFVSSLKNTIATDTDSWLATKRKGITKQQPFLHARNEKIVSCYPIPRFNLFTEGGFQLLSETEIIGTYGVKPNEKKECVLYLKNDPVKQSTPDLVRQTIRITVVTPEDERIHVTVHPNDKVSKLTQLAAEEVKNDPKLTKSLAKVQKSPEVRAGSRWGETSQQRALLAHDGRALDQNATIASYNLHDDDSVFLHKKMKIYVDPRNMFKESTSVKEEFKKMYPNEDINAVHVFQTDTILQLKQEIRKLYNIPIQRFYLAHGAICHESKTIMGSGIKWESTVFMHRIETRTTNIALEPIKFKRQKPIPNHDHEEIRIFVTCPRIAHEFKLKVTKGEKVKVVQMKMCQMLKDYFLEFPQKFIDEKFKKLDETTFDDYTKFSIRQNGVTLLLTVKKLSDYNIQNLASIVMDME